MITKELRAAVDAFVAANEENVVRDIKRLVDINSVEGTPEPGKPFGAGPAAALDEALKMAAEMGLSTNNCEGYMGWAELPGETDKQIATITHLDVVPSGQRLDRRSLRHAGAGRLDHRPRCGRRQGPQRAVPVCAEVPQGA